MTAYARHPQLRRRSFRFGIFWKQIHWDAVPGADRPRCCRPAGTRCAPGSPTRTCATSGRAGKVEGGGPLLAPYFVLHDLVEVAAVARAAVRTRTPML